MSAVLAESFSRGEKGPTRPVLERARAWPALRLALLLMTSLSVASIGCGTPIGEGAADAEAWVGTITTEGDVTTVRNESGSVWGGTARLVEEASIGVEAGEDPYMLGSVRGVAASDDRIYVIDSQIPALRAYDWRGAYLQDLGREGDGPGEFRFPTGVGVDEAGRVWLHDQISTRLVVFSPEGEALATMNLGGMRISGTASTMTVTPDGHAYVLNIMRPDPAAATATALRRVMKPFDIDGVAGEPIELPRPDEESRAGGMQAQIEGVVRFAMVPFHPGLVYVFAPTRAVLVGVPDTYRFEMRYPDGKRTVVERSWEPVAVLGDEAAAHEQAVTRYMRGLEPGWIWSGPPIPATKPAFSSFIPAVSGEVWVVRPGPATRQPDCDEEEFDLDGEAHCWPEQRVVDVFGAEGRYLGEVEVPDDVSFDPPPFIRGHDVIARVEDEAGIVRVKRYRLMPPSEGVGSN